MSRSDFLDNSGILRLVWLAALGGLVMAPGALAQEVGDSDADGLPDAFGASPQNGATALAQHLVGAESPVACTGLCP